MIPRAVVFILASAALFGSEREDPLTYDKTILVGVGRKVVHVTIEKAPFWNAPSRLAVKNGHLMIDGQRPYGIDATGKSDPRSLPRFEIVRFSVRFADKEVKIPLRAYSMLFNPWLQPRAGLWDDSGSVLALASADGRSVVITLSGSDSAGAYNAIIVVWRDGSATLFVDDSTP